MKQTLEESIADVLTEATRGKLELTSLDPSKQKINEKVVRAAYPRNLTYRGMEFFDKIYMGAIIPTVEREIDKEIVKTSDSGRKWTTEDLGQESFLGYLPKEDLFLSGWDLAAGQDEPPRYDDEEEEFNHDEEDDIVHLIEDNVFVVKVNEHGVASVIPHVKSMKILGNTTVGSRIGEFMGMYPKRLKELQRRQKQMVGIRYD